MYVDWKGVFPAATTLFHPDQSLDLDSTRNHVEMMIDAGIHGVIMLGTVGENCSLTHSEKITILKATVARMKTRAKAAKGFGLTWSAIPILSKLVEPLIP